jgi:hypothetical protein
LGWVDLDFSFFSGDGGKGLSLCGLDFGDGGKLLLLFGSLSGGLGQAIDTSRVTCICLWQAIDIL